MNETMELLRERKSVRVFKDKNISKKIREEILEAAFQAPSAGCQMLYSIIDVKDQNIKDTLAQTCDNQPFIAKAPFVLIFLADCRKWFEAYKLAGCTPNPPEEGNLMIAIADALIAAQNAVVAASSFGIGSCYIGDILENVETHKELLGFDEYVFPAAMVVFGYPTKQQRERKKPKRFDKKYVVFTDKYTPLDETLTREMFESWAVSSGRENFDFEQYIKAFHDRKYSSDFADEMTRSAKIYLQNFTKSDVKKEIKKGRPKKS